MMASLNQIKHTILLAALRVELRGDRLLVDIILLVMADHGVLPTYVMIALGDLVSCGLVGPGLAGEVKLTETGRYWAEQCDRASRDQAAVESAAWKN